MRRFLILMGMVSMTMAGHAQLDTRDLHRAFDSYRQEIASDFGDFRQQIHEEYIEFLRNPWKEFEAEEPVPMPIEKQDPPIVIPEEDKVKPIEDKPIVVEDTIRPVPITPQPTPIQPIEENLVVDNTVSILFFGSEHKVRFDETQTFKLGKLSEDEVANAFAILTTETYNNVVVDCLEIRKKLQLCDWAYLLLIKTVSEKLYGAGTNEASLLCAYIYAESGYKMRLATDGQKIYMLYASKHSVYEQTSFLVDGDYYYCMEELPNQLRISEASFRDEQGLSLLISKPQVFSAKMTEERKISSKDYAEVQVLTKVNRNALDFYESYPSSYYNEDFMTRWAIYANTPMEKEVSLSFYPKLRQHLSNLTQLDAANRLLNWVQTGFEYEYDDKVWGGDRAFFAEETLYYPYCDCEDRSILFSRLVRDLLGLDVLLVYYPGHLATAVGFTEEVRGDYIMCKGKRYVVCDPTYIGAPVGRTMPKMDNAKAKVILLQ